MKQMSSKERTIETFKHNKTDYTPLHLEMHPSYDVHTDVVKYKDQYERLDFLLELGVDAAVELWIPTPTFDPSVQVKEWREELPGEDYNLLYKEYHTPAGVLRQVIKETEDFYDLYSITRNTVGNIGNKLKGIGLLEDANPSRYVEFPINSEADLEKMRYLFRPLTGDAYAKWKEDALYAKKQAQQRDVILLARRMFCGSAMLWLTDTIKTIISFSDGLDYINEFLSIIHSWQMKNLEMVLDIGVDVVTRFGYYDIPDFWGVEYFKKLLAPRMDEEAELCHQRGAWLSQQQSEGLTQQVEIYKNMKVDILRDVDPIQGHEDLALLKRELGDKKTLWGGINLLELEGDQRVDVDKMVKNAMDAMAPGGGFVLYPIPGVYAEAKWEYVLEMIEAWKRYRYSYL